MANFRATPSDGGSHPGLIVIQEFWGVNDHIKDITQRLANEGFIALAVDLYDDRIAATAQEAMQMLQSLDQKAALDKLQKGVEQLKADSQVDAGKVGVIGFCMGGSWALNLAAANSDIKVAVPFYGRVPPDTTLQKISVPVLCVYAGQDNHIPVSEPNRVVEALKKKGVPVELKVYADAQHAFMNDTRKEVYSPNDAHDAFARAVTFLKKYLR